MNTIFFSAPENPAANTSEQTLGYLHKLYGPANGEGFLAVWNKATKRTEFFPATHSGLSEAEAYMLSQARMVDVYFGWGLQSSPCAGRGASETVMYSPGIMFDADLKSDIPGVHSNDKLPETPEQVYAWIEEAGLPVPSMVRSSGNGLYLDYFHEPVFLRSDAERRDYAITMGGFHRKLILDAQRRRGWKFDFTGDLARVTRMPGTFNHKTNPAKPVAVIR
jgi:hypothetical protein